MADGAERLVVVGRIRKPHGLKGSITVFPLTDEPEPVFAAGQSLVVKELDGRELDERVVVEWAKPYHREWLLKFRGLERVEEVEWLRGRFLASHASRLTPLAQDEVWLSELEGYAVALPDGTALGLVTGWYELPAGLALEVQGPRREFLLPFRKEFVVQLDREARRLTVQVPDGLIEE
jgi:16S rRNA processing protein RimM